MSLNRSHATAPAQPGWDWWAAVTLAAGVLVSIYELVRWIDPVDFFVYYYAGQTALLGQTVYGDVVSGPQLAAGLPYNYGPAGLLVFAGLSVLRLDVAFILWSIAQLIMLAWIIQRLLPTQSRPIRCTLAWLALMAPTTVLAQQMLWGQINIMLMTLCLAGCMIRGTVWTPRLVGALIGIATAIKLTPGLFLVYFLVARRWKEAFWTCLSGATITALSAVFFFDEAVRFFTHALWDLSDRVALGEYFATPGNNSIQGAAAFFGATGWPVLLVVGTVAITGLAAAIRVGRNAGLLPALLLIGLLSPLLSPVSWIHHFIFVLPAVVFLWHRVSTSWRGALVAVMTVMWAQGTDLGGFLVEEGGPLIWPLAVLLRESLLMSSVVLIGCLLDFSAHRRAAPRNHVPGGIAATLPGELPASDGLRSTKAQRSSETD